MPAVWGEIFHFDVMEIEEIFDVSGINLSVVSYSEVENGGRDMRKWTGLFGNMIYRKIRMRAGGRGNVIRRRRGRAPRRGTGGGTKLSNSLPICVFAVVLLVYAMANAPFEDKAETQPVFHGMETLIEKLNVFKENADAKNTDKDVTLDDLAAKSSETIRVLTEETGEIKEVPLEEYTACVVASEMPSDFEEEALKAQAVAARTYAAARKSEFEEGKCSHYDEGAYVCNATHCQVYRDEAGLRKVKGDEWMEQSFPKILSAVNETAGEVLYYDGALVKQPLFFSSSGDKTENSEDVFVSAIPYLRSVESGVYEEESPHKDVETVVDMADLKAKVSSAYGSEAAASITAETIEIVSRTDGGTVAVMKIGTLELTGRQVRSLLGLPSAEFEVSATADTVTFTTSGSGHQVGLSQYGANGMAKQGKTYKEILSHYYSGVEIEKM